VNPHRWATKYFEKAVGLSDFGYRFYDASLGRWISSDPEEEGGGINLLAYVRNNPADRVDALGLSDSNYNEATFPALLGPTKITPGDHPLPELKGKSFPARCATCPTNFKFTDAFFHYVRGEAALDHQGRIVLAVKMTIEPTKQAGCDNFKILQFIREFEMRDNVPVPRGKQGSAQRQGRSTKEGWRVDSGILEYDDAGQPYWDDTQYGTAPGVGKPGKYWDVPYENKTNNGYEIYTCLVCVKNGSSEVIAGLKWGFVVKDRGNNMLQNASVRSRLEDFKADLYPLVPEPVCPDSPAFKHVVSTAIAQWNSFENIKINVAK
jgi:RHS repeat-associated protein